MKIIFLFISFCFALDTKDELRLLKLKFGNSKFSLLKKVKEFSIYRNFGKFIIIDRKKSKVVWYRNKESEWFYRPPKLVAHRGASLLAPENTISSIKLAIEGGADSVEVDVRQTKDKKWILFHDNYLYRLANKSKSVKDCTYSELRKLDIGSWFDPHYSDEKIPLLSEVLDLIKKSNKKIHLDLKSGNIYDLIKLVKNKKMSDQVILYSLNPWVMKKFEEKSFKTRIQLVGQVFGLELVSLIYKSNLLNFVGPQIRARMITRAHLKNKLAFLNILGKKVEEKIKRAFHMGADFIQVDDVLNSRKVLNSLYLQDMTRLKMIIREI